MSWLPQTHLSTLHLVEHCTKKSVLVLEIKPPGHSAFAVPARTECAHGELNTVGKVDKEPLCAM